MLRSNGKKYCAQCRNGERKTPADYYVTGKTDEDRPYRAYLCEEHLGMLSWDGYEFSRIVNLAEEAEKAEQRRAARKARMEIAKPRPTADQTAQQFIDRHIFAGNIDDAILAENVMAELVDFADILTKKLSGFDSFEHMLNASTHGYRPTIRTEEGPEYMALAKLYNYAQRVRGSDVRSYSPAPVR